MVEESRAVNFVADEDERDEVVDGSPILDQMYKDTVSAEGGLLQDKPLAVANEDEVQVTMFGGVSRAFYQSILRTGTHRAVERLAYDIGEVRLPMQRSAAATALRLDLVAPPEQRIADGIYIQGREGRVGALGEADEARLGSDFSTIPDEILDRPGPSLSITQAENDDLMADALFRSSSIAQEVAAEVKLRAPTLEVIAKGLGETNRARWWYELSGEEFARTLDELTETEKFFFLDLIGVTSQRTKPNDNLQRSLAILSQRIRGEPLVVDVIDETAVRGSFNRIGDLAFDLDKNKTAQFSQTFAYVMGLVPDTEAPIPVNDGWMAGVFGINDKQLAANQSLHEVMTLYQNNLRDLLNSRLTTQELLGEPLQSWQLQAMLWTGSRGVPQDFSGSGAMASVYKKLKFGGFEIEPGDKISRAMLLDPRFVDALRPTVPVFRKAFVANVEFGTKLTENGKAAAAVFADAVMKNNTRVTDAYLKILSSEMRKARSGSKKEERVPIFAKLVEALTGSKKATTRIAIPTSARPFDSAGSYLGELSPNIRIPLRGLTRKQRRLFNAFIIKHFNQEMGGIARFATVAGNETSERVAKNMTRHLGIWANTTDDISEEQFRTIVSSLTQIAPGFELKIDRRGNGYMFDFFPKFLDEGGTEPISRDTVDKLMSLPGLRELNDLEVLRRDFESVIGYDAVFIGEEEAILNTFRTEVTEDATGQLRKLGLSKTAAGRFLTRRSPGGVETEIAKRSGNDRRKARGIRTAWRRQLDAFASATESARKTSISLDKRFAAYATQFGGGA